MEKKEADVKWPFKYLEGSDQHRGWFHSSLLDSCGTRGRAPFEKYFKPCLFSMDTSDLMRSKFWESLSVILKKYGADILN